LVVLAVCVAAHALSVEAEVEAEIDAEFQQGVSAAACASTQNAVDKSVRELLEAARRSRAQFKKTNAAIKAALDARKRRAANLRNKSLQERKERRAREAKERAARAARAAAEALAKALGAPIVVGRGSRRSRGAVSQTSQDRAIIKAKEEARRKYIANLTEEKRRKYVAKLAKQKAAREARERRLAAQRVAEAARKARESKRQLALQRRLAEQKRRIAAIKAKEAALRKKLQDAQLAAEKRAKLVAAQKRLAEKRRQEQLRQAALKAKLAREKAAREARERQLARERAAEAARQAALKAKLQLEECTRNYNFLLKSLAKQRGFSLLEVEGRPAQNLASNARVCGAFSLDAARKEAARLEALHRKREAEAALRRSEALKKELARIRELQRRAAEEAREAERRRIAKQQADREAAIAAAEAARLAKKARLIRERAAAALRISSSYRRGGFNKPYSAPFSWATCSASDDPHWFMFESGGHDSMVWGWFTFLKTPIATVQVYSSYCGYWGGAEDTPRPPTCIKRGLIEVIVPGTEARLVSSSDGYIRQWGTNGPNSGSTYLDGRYNVYPGQVYCAGATCSDPDMALNLRISRGSISFSIPRAGVNPGQVSGLCGALSGDRSVEGNFRNIDGSLSVLRNWQSDNDEYEGCFWCGGGATEAGKRHKMTGWWATRTNGPRVKVWANQYAVGQPSNPPIDLDMAPAAMERFWASQAFKINLIEIEQLNESERKKGKAAKKAWKFPKAKSLALQKVVETPAKKAFCKKLLKNIKKNYARHWKSCIQDGDFPELSKAIVKTIKRRRAQKKAVKVALKKAIRRQQKLVEKCGINVKIPVVKFGGFSKKLRALALEGTTKNVQYKTTAQFHLLKSAAIASTLYAAKHKRMAKMARSGKSKKQQLMRHHLYKASAHTANKLAKKHLKIVRKAKRSAKKGGKKPVRRLNRRRTGHKRRALVETEAEVDADVEGPTKNNKKKGYASA